MRTIARKTMIFWSVPAIRNGLAATLEAGTTVIPTGTPDESVNGFQYRWITVMEGMHKNDTGLIRLEALNDASVAGAAVRGITATGVKYGASQRGANAHLVSLPDDVGTLVVGMSPADQQTGGRVNVTFPSNAVANQWQVLSNHQLWAGTKSCQICGGARGDHKVLETSQTRNDADQLYRAMRRLAASDASFNTSATYGDDAAFMFGVLRVAGTDKRYAAVSGQFRPSFDWICIEEDFESSTHTLHFEAEEDYTPPRLLNCRGQEAQAINSLRGMMTCAAPRLIQAAINGLRPTIAENRPTFYMTEMWYNPGGNHADYSDRETIDSCDKCRLIIPYMLCGHYNPFKKSERNHGMLTDNRT